MNGALNTDGTATVYRSATHAQSGSINSRIGSNQFNYTNVESSISTISHEAFHLSNTTARNFGHPRANYQGDADVNNYRDYLRN